MVEKELESNCAEKPFCLTSWLYKSIVNYAHFIILRMTDLYATIICEVSMLFGEIERKVLHEAADCGGSKNNKNVTPKNVWPCVCFNVLWRVKCKKV